MAAPPSTTPPPTAPFPGMTHPGEPRNEVQSMMIRTEQKTRDVLNVPDNYRVLFMWGGAVGTVDDIYPTALCRPTLCRVTLPARAHPVDNLRHPRGWVVRACCDPAASSLDRTHCWIRPQASLRPCR